MQNECINNWMLSFLLMLLLAGSLIPSTGKTEMVFTGAIAGKYPITMKLKISDTSIGGVYFYDKYKKDIELSGTIGRDGHFVLNEKTADGKVSGSFSGDFVGGNRLEGNWSAAIGSKTLPFILCHISPESENVAKSMLNPLSRVMDVIRLPDETTDEFVKKNGPSVEEKLAYPVMEAESEIKGLRTIITFYYESYRHERAVQTRIQGLMFVPVGVDRYRKVIIDTYDVNGGDPKLEAAFFANADHEPAEELVVICSWALNSYDFSGNYFSTSIYKMPQPNGREEKLRLLKEIDGGLDGDRRNEIEEWESVVSKNKTEEQVRATLKKMGY